ncbi:MAG TPA: CbiX/SirB N-terminal domain-containing protein, partial [Acidimicrobiales bacterium]|nr:CbiX/SirB N-terminal domain-containing protein [Acidimicrobiales bacterium]
TPAGQHHPRPGGAGPGAAADLLLIGHGSRDPAAAAEFAALRDLVAARLGARRVGGGFLELAEPPIDRAVDDLVAAGATEVVAVPYVLFGAGHLKDDGPAVLARARRRHPGVSFHLARDLGTHPAVLAVAEERARQAIAALPAGGGAPPTVVLAGRGSTDPDACAEFVKLARLLGDGRGLGPVEPAFVAMTTPSVEDALDRARRLGADRLAVVPLFLFSGVLVDRIGERARSWAADRPGVAVATAPPLGADERLADLVVERFVEPLRGDVRMNCDLCSYRVRLPGFEERVGTPLSLAPPERAPRGWRARRAANQAAAEAGERRERPRRGLGRRSGVPAAPDRDGPAVVVSGLTHRWPDGSVGLAGVDLEVAARERIAVLGPNGSGKSTLALHLVGALGGGQDGGATTGTVRVAGLPVARATLAAVRRRVGLVFQDPDDQILLPTVAADVGFAPANHGVPAGEVAARVAAALGVVGLADAAERAPEHLSLGERRRVALAGVLAAHPEVLVLDEPTANLDPAARRDLIEVIRGLELTTLVITHDLPLALELCPRSVVLAHGRVAAEGATPALLANPSLLAAHRLELPYRMVAPAPGERRVPVT